MHMHLKLYNTLTKDKQVFDPLEPDNVRLYVCGPTVYDDAHIGNARPIIVFDLLYRLLRQIYGAEHVTYVRNLTDVDDKINRRAFERKMSIRTLTDETIKRFHEDIRALGVLMPEDVNGNGHPPRFIEPRATDFICRKEPDAIDMISIIARLIQRGHAYEAQGHVLFHVPSMPGYGKLARRSLDEMAAGARVEIAPYKRDAMDFVLWKPSVAAHEPGWDSPWGYGRPGWHIECSAMSAALLGETFDIHGGGIDLVFPHHENEIAQSCCAFGTDTMAQIWMHNGFLQVEGQKMSKSLGNFITIREVLKDWPGDVIRYTMLKTHYRQPIDWTVKGLEESTKNLNHWYGYEEEAGPAFHPLVLSALSDDMNTPKAFAELHGLDKSKNYKALISSLKAFGWARPNPAPQEGNAPSSLIETLITQRLAARASKNWAESDRIRDELKAQSILLKDNKDGTTTWEQAP
jgi:cysteinyl-tRNA synthetase